MGPANKPRLVVLHTLHLLNWLSVRNDVFEPFLKLIYPAVRKAFMCSTHVVLFVLSDSTFTPWQKDASGNMKRCLNYTITINNPLIGKFSTATENQVCLHQCE